MMINDPVYQLFTEELGKHNLNLTSRQWEQFEIYCQELIEWNERMNLTAIKERESIYIKHFFDSISLSFFYPVSNVITIADIGSGAGFPSIPLKIMFPHLKVTIVDSLNKRIQFLNHLTEQLKIDGVKCIHGRAEDLARQPQFRDKFELVTARAVAKLSALNELCLPFVQKDGVFISMKGSDPEEELSGAKYSMKQLHAKLAKVASFDLPVEQSRRHFIIMKKTAATPAKYPRKAGIPIKNPLI
jgi:16S rRNA (guanine527-N7)-methyltransferase